MLLRLLFFIKTKSEIPLKKQKSLYCLLFTLCFLNIWDLGVTLWLTQYFGYEIELNPFLQRLFLISPTAVISYKLGTLALFIIIIHWVAKKNFYFAYRSTQVVVAILFVIGIYHTLNLFTLSKYITIFSFHKY
jgi:hypothetical protein